MSVTRPVRPAAPALAAFTAPTLAMGALGLPVVFYLPEYYSNALGLPLAAVGAAFMGVRLLDILLDPFLGGLMDRTRSRWGRFRPWLAASVPLLALAGWMLFMAGPGVTPFYLWFWLMILYAGVSICVLSHSAWAATLSPDYHERSRIYGWWQAGNVAGLILVLLLPAFLDALTPSDHGARIRVMGWFVVVLIPVAIGIAVLRAPEPIHPRSSHRNGWRDYVALLKRPTVRRVLAADLLLALAPGLIAALLLFYFERVKGFDKPQVGMLLLAYLASALACSPVWTAAARHFGKHRALAFAGLVVAAAQVGVTLVPAGSFWLALAAMILVGIPYTAGPSLLRSMLADVADEEQVASGADRRGLLYAILVGTSKLGYALSVGIAFVALDLIGFEANESGNPGAGLDGLQALFVIGPAACGTLAAWACFHYPLDARRHADIRAQLANGDGAESGDAAPLRLDR